MWWEPPALEVRYTHFASFDQGMYLVWYLSGVEVLATVACLLIKPLRPVGAGLFAALFFTPVALLILGFIMVLVLGPATF